MNLFGLNVLYLATGFVISAYVLVSKAKGRQVREGLIGVGLGIGLI